MTIVLAVIAIALTAQAQLVQPVKWVGVVEGDSIRITATIEDGWHLNIIELGDGFYVDEYEGTFTETVALVDTIHVRFNACSNKMCTAPETWEYVAIDDKTKGNETTSTASVETIQGVKLLWLIFIIGLLGGLIAILFYYRIDIRK